MQRIAKFHKVSEARFTEDWSDTFPEYTREEISRIYQDIRLPKRATKGSAGYDFYAPAGILLKPGRP